MTHRCENCGDLLEGNYPCDTCGHDPSFEDYADEPDLVFDGGQAPQTREPPEQRVRGGGEIEDTTEFSSPLAEPEYRSVGFECVCGATRETPLGMARHRAFCSEVVDP